MGAVPEVRISSCDKFMPIIGMGTAVSILSKENDKETMKAAFIEAIRVGYRHFDTSSIYQSEQPLDKDLVLPAIKLSLRKLQLEYLDLYLIHVPVKQSQEEDNQRSNIAKDMISPIDIKGVWEGMEECKNLGLTKAIGVSNFPRSKLEELLSVAKIPPAVNQVEMNPTWHQKKLREFCKEKGIHVTAYSPLGAYKDMWGHKSIMESNVLEEIAKAKGKTKAQIALRWVYEQGGSAVPKSLNKERMKENLQIFDWCLTEEELNKIDRHPQQKAVYFAKTMAAGPSLDFIHELDAEL
ncbi:Aldo/keto reductase [Melia azedarach]|uniref:Aldo/keto reductase n=1 Tax=Melia azedarach TaxID=155640 RepID=A0ACC1XR00_MELAZ|nr:Aldo/keto reductase [Melia azedarach]